MTDEAPTTVEDRLESIEQAIERLEEEIRSQDSAEFWDKHLEELRAIGFEVTGIASKKHDSWGGVIAILLALILFRLWHS